MYKWVKIYIYKCLSGFKSIYILGCFLFPKLTVEKNTGSNMILQVIKLFSNLQMKIDKNQEKSFKNVFENF